MKNRWGGRQDGVHYPEAFVREMLTESLEVVGDEVTLKPAGEGLSFAEMFGNRCGKYGRGRHRM